MKKSVKFILILVISLVLMIGCAKDEASESNFEQLLNYLDNNGMTINELMSSWVIAADSTLYAEKDNYYFLDLRNSDMNENGITDFEEGHIEGSVMASFDNVLDLADDIDKPIIVVCYTGQNAGVAVMSLRLSGYADARVLKWGMSGWNSDFDSWTPNIGNIQHANWVAAPGNIAANQIFSLPDLEAAGENGAEILAERVAAVLAAGFQSVNFIDVLETPGDYFINNYWTADNVAEFGNVAGAYRIMPLVLENLDSSGEIAVYCWTGQTSTMIATYLNVLGYNAKSIKFGVNKIMNEVLTQNKWSASVSAELPYVITP